MPPPILNDSEDEEDDIVYDDSKDGSLSRSSGEPAPGISTLDGTRDTINQSTGSTERLKKQIHDAHRNLFGEPSEQLPLNDAPTVSPTLRSDKRRYSSFTKPETSMDSVKRVKTTTTYSTKKATSSSVDRDKFFAAFGQDAIAPNTSQSIRFSDHSGARASSGLPAGSMQTDFANHDPAMFKESGSTVPDNESSHERMVEQALRSKSLKAISSPGIKLVESDELPKSSSFPWSASEQTESTRSHRAKDLHAHHTDADAETNEDSPTTRNEDERCDQQRFDAEQPAEDFNDTSKASGKHNAQPIQTGVQESSPTVEINIGEMKAQVQEQPSSEIAQKAGRGRKRKVQEQLSEPLNSDDIAVGLPKERYKPRPSRRRATQTTEEPIDYSVVPEKAAKSKRSKTVGGMLSSSTDQSEALQKQPSPSMDRQPDFEPTDAADTTDVVAKSSLRIEEIQDTPAELPYVSPVVEVPKGVGSQSVPTGAAAQPTATPTAQASTNSPPEDTIFVKPALKQKSASKSKRSATTIFEDHVDFTGKSRFPSLSQQQIIREAALQDVKNEATSAKFRRGGKPVIRDDDEDELAFDPEPPEEQPEEAPKKRGRGRPSKAASKASAAKTPAKSAKQVNENVEADDDDDKLAVEEPPKKRRGRPSKSAVSEPSVDDSKEADREVAEEKQPDEDQASAKESIEMPVDESTPARQNSAGVIPTPSPDKHAQARESAAPQKPPAKTSPVTHSPIKSSSPAPHRVGLSKKHRIPSLLKVMRPPPPKRG